MRKFECRRCAKTCTLLLDENLAIPRSCIYGNRESLWCAIKEDSAENEQFGNSEQLPSNPRKLPDWVKVGNLVYCSKTGNYGEIITIEDNNIYIRIVNTDEVFPVKLNMVLQNGRPARKRPFNDDEMKALVGKVITDEDSGNAYLINQYYSKKNEVKFNGFWLTNKDLMNNDNYTINGKPCYKLEHLENGEWVE